MYPEVLRLAIHKERMEAKSPEVKQKGSFVVTGDTEGNVIVTEVMDSLVFSTFHLLQENEIFDIRGKRIYLEKPPLDTSILLPPGKSGKDIKSYEEMKGIPRTIRSNQSVVLIDGQKVVNPIIIISSLEGS